MPDKPSTADPGKPGRRWFQFRLRTLMLAVAAAAAWSPLLARAVSAWEEYQLEQWAMLHRPRVLIIVDPSYSMQVRADDMNEDSGNGH